MTRRNDCCWYPLFERLTTLVFFLMFLTFISAFSAHAADNDRGDKPEWTIYFNSGVRFGTDNRTLYIMDFLVPLYRDDKNILFANPRYTPNDQDGWEVNGSPWVSSK